MFRLRALSFSLSKKSVKSQIEVVVFCLRVSYTSSQSYGSPFTSVVDNPAAISKNNFFLYFQLFHCRYVCIQCYAFNSVTHVVYTMTATAAKAVGLIKGLAEIVKLQQTTQATQQSETTTQLQQLLNTVHDLSQVIKTTQKKATPQQALRLPNLILPEFTGREDLDRFLDQVLTLLEASGVPPQHLLNNSVSVMYVHMMPF